MVRRRAYDDDDSVLCGVDRIEDVIDHAECVLFGELDKLEKARSPLDLMLLASTLCELAVLPCTPADDAEAYWEKAKEASARAQQGAPDESGIATQAAHVVLRQALMLSLSDRPDEADELFNEAAESIGLFWSWPLCELC